MRANCRTLISIHQQVFGKIYARIREKFGARHFVRGDQNAIAFIANNTVPIPQKIPKIRRMVDRPLPKRLKILLPVKLCLFVNK